ncbi:aldehyde dehydrogenase family protein [Porticoccus sp.]|nr:MAG: aldehyde dehydrogenase family protein [Gammaproteobacteria bacterium]
MKDCRQFYINGQWVAPQSADDLAVENPATEQTIAVISQGTRDDLNRAVAAAKKAFQEYSQTTREQRIALLEALLAVYEARYEEMACAISMEMGAPISFARSDQADCGRGHLKSALRALRDYPFEQSLGKTLVVREAIGVCGLITPWNWPINQIACKVAPALATGCTMILKPSEIAPLSAHLFAEMIHEAGFPPGVFNLVDGAGPVIGQGLAEHPDIDMVSFTGSTRAGVAVAKAAADSVKGVAQELGGKSPNLLLDDADMEQAVTRGVAWCMENTGQSCNAPTRMLVPEQHYEQAVAIAAKAAAAVTVGLPHEEGSHIGPLSSRAQFDKVQHLIEIAIKEGARVVAGGLGKPEGFTTGHFVRPTVFADVNNRMTIAREEVFGPVLVMIPYRDEAEAIDIANDTPYGLAAYIQTGDPQRGQRIARRLRAGMVRINGASHGYNAPFGGYKQSGNGREWGEYGFEDYLEIKAING